MAAVDADPYLRSLLGADSSKEPATFRVYPGASGQVGALAEYHLGFTSTAARITFFIDKTGVARIDRVEVLPEYILPVPPDEVAAAAALVPFFVIDKSAKVLGQQLLFRSRNSPHYGHLVIRLMMQKGNAFLKQTALVDMYLNAPF